MNKIKWFFKEFSEDIFFLFKKKLTPKSEYKQAYTLGWDTGAMKVLIKLREDSLISEKTYRKYLSLFKL